jgi:DeoR/GlpR family transcriptional regulator of sugar metabolism
MENQLRHGMIIELVQEKGEVSVAELSASIGVSSMTIRRDLETLESEGALQRVHGGAIIDASRSYILPYSVRTQRNKDAKERIGAAAATLLQDREAVILDAGTTTLEVARALRGRRNLTVVTLSLQVANLLVKNRGIRLIMTGGTVVPGEQSMVGDFAENAFSNVRCDTFVMGVGGICLESGCTDFSLDDARVKRAALARAQRCIVVADSSKLGKVCFAQICPLGRLDVLVTDSGVSEESLSRFAEERVEVVVV